MSPNSTVDQLIASVISCCNIPREKWSKIYLIKACSLSDAPSLDLFVPGILTVDQIQQDWLPLRAMCFDEKAI